jgi:hypothetical protein
MTVLKQGAINQIPFVAVDKTDFATIESGVTSNFTVTLRGVKHGVSDASSSISISRVPSVIHSGIFKQTLEAADTSGLDYAILNIKHASCADQNIPLDFTMQDVSNYLSNISAMVSDVDSQLLLTASDVSNILVDTDAMTSTLSGLSDTISDIYVDTDAMTSTLSGLSNTLSQVLVDTAEIGVSGAGLQSAIASAVWNEPYSNITTASTIGSYMQGIGGGTPATIASAVWSRNPSDISALSTVGSLMVKFQNSAVAATIADADMSNIVSRVWGEKYNVHSALASSFGSFVTQQIQGLSNIQSGMSNTLSAVLVDTADISNIASQILADTATLAGMSNILSQVAVDTADISNVLSNTHGDLANLSNIASQILADTTEASNYLSNISAVLSNVHSTVDGISNVQSGMSNTLSQVLVDTADVSNYLSNMSNVLSDVDSKVTSVESVLSDVSSRIPAALVGGRIDADIGAISTSTDAANKLEASAEIIILGSANADLGSSTVSNFSTTLTKNINDFYNGRVMIFTTGTLTGQATTISDYIGASSQVKVVALTAAPAAGDSFCIL